MRGAEASGRETRPLRIEPESGKVGQHVSQSGRAQSWHVLSDDDGGLGDSHDAGKFGPEPSVIVLGEAFTGDADGLARESSGNDARRRRGGDEVSDIGEPLGLGEVAGQHLSTPRVDLDLPRRRAEARPLQSKVKEADPAEQGANHRTPVTSMSILYAMPNRVSTLNATWILIPWIMVFQTGAAGQAHGEWASAGAAAVPMLVEMSLFAIHGPVRPVDLALQHAEERRRHGVPRRHLVNEIFAIDLGHSVPFLPRS